MSQYGVRKRSRSVRGGGPHFIKRRSRRGGVLALLLLGVVCAVVYIYGKKYANQAYGYPSSGGSAAAAGGKITGPAENSRTGKTFNELVANKYRLEDFQLDYLDELEELFSGRPDIAPILENLALYPEELLKLILNEPDAITFAAGFADNLSVRHKPREIDVSKDISEADGFVHFLQWDERWGYDGYGDSIIAIAGCGAVSLSMVAVQLTGDTNANPLAVADFSVENGYYADGVGTSWSLMTEGAKNFGLIGKEIPLDPNAIINALENKMPVIVSMGPGDFTTAGHFVVLTGVTPEGKIRIKDSNSRIRTEKEWDIDVFLTQAKNLWSFTKAD